MTDPMASQPLVDNHVFLIGRPPLGEYLGFIRTLTVDGQSANQGQLTEEWRAANDHVRELEKREAKWADQPTIEPLPKELHNLRDLVLADPMYRRSYQVVPTEIGMVDLDRLVVFQKHIDLTYVEGLKKGLGRSPTAEVLFRFCLPFHHPHPSARVMQTAANSFSFISASNDFRFIEAVLLSPQQLQNYAPQGPVVAVLGLVVGYGSNFLNALFVEDRLILNNGSHRAFALRDMGISRVPCIVQRVSRREELELVGSGDVQQNPDRYLKAARPPVLKDYFDPALRKVVPVPRKLRQVRISFGLEQTDIPAG
jgi:hypothetical protein